jgi:integrase
MGNEKALALSDKKIKERKKTAGKKWLRDGGGLALCFTSPKSGPWRHWYFIYTSPENGKKVYKPLGPYPEVSLKAARKEAIALRAALGKQIDPKAEERRAVEAKLRVEAEQQRLRELEERTLSVAELIDEYIEKHAKPNKRGWAEDKRILEHDALKVWGKRKAADITKRDVVLLLESIVKRGSPGSANNNFKIIRKMFRFAVERDILQHTPCETVVMPAPLVTKDRALSEKEVRTFWHVLDTCHISDEIRRVLRLILVTAQRPGEVVGMHTKEIDGRWWTIPAERSKNKRSHRVYLTDTALKLIGPLQARDPDTNEIVAKGHIFPSPRTNKEADGSILPRKPIAVNALAHAIRRNYASPILVKGKPVFDKDKKIVTENKLGLDYFTPHDLRRTATTIMASCKIIKEHRERVLNHTLEKLDGTYNQHDYDDEKQVALEELEIKIDCILNSKEYRTRQQRERDQEIAVHKA